jgi:hypothetical protein
MGNIIKLVFALWIAKKFILENELVTFLKDKLKKEMKDFIS